MTEKELNRNAWQYTLIWPIEEKEIDVYREEIENEMTKLLRKHMAVLKAVKVREAQIMILMEAEQQLNIGRLEKSIETVINRYLKILGMSQMISSCLAKAGEDKRLQKLLKHLWACDYYDLEEGFEEELEAFKSYLFNRRLGIIENKESLFLIDQEALMQPINLNCFACTKKESYGCCGGSPCDMSSKNRNYLDKHLTAIEEMMQQLDPESYKALLLNKGMFTANGKIKAYDGHCSMLIKHEGVNKCIAHKYALDNGLSPYELCSLSCLMYPLEILELRVSRQKKIYFLTAALEEEFTEKYSRWGSYKTLDAELRCINIQKHNDLFKKEDYKPIYEVNKALLIHEFGEVFFDCLNILFK